MPEKYDRIGQGYNQTRMADPYLFSRMLALLKPEPFGNYLDLGCGTGNYTIEFAKRGFSFTGVEPSDRMLQKARSRYAGIMWEKGYAENIPQFDESMDGVLASLTIHHWSNLYAGIAEVGRVLKAGAPFLLFTATPEQMEGYWLNHYFPKMLQASIEQMPSYEEVESAVQAGGMQIVETEAYDVRDDLQDKFLNVGKNEPELYLREDIRRGISSFADLANQDEVQNGLAQLESDILSGRVKEVIAAYENDLGDYLFVKAIKLA